MPCKRISFTGILLIALLVTLLSSPVLGQTGININIGGRNLIHIGGGVTVPANQVVENAQAVGGSVTVQQGARVTQTAIAVGGNVVLKSGARVDGDAYSIGGQVITEPGASIGGESIVKEQREAESQPERFWLSYVFNAFWHILTVLIGMGIGVLLLRWRPGFMTTLAATLDQYPGRTILWGVGGAIAVVALIVFLAITLIGIPLIPLVGLGAMVTALAGSLGVALWLGQRLFSSSRRTRIQQFLLGSLIIGAIGLVPVVGGLVLLVMYVLGLGAILAWQVGRTQAQITG